jgi:OmcA/MtrC family decaheme c-type cytochrome
MSRNRSAFRSIALVAASLLLFALAGCGGGDGGGGGATTAAATPVTGNALNINITSVTTNGPPVVNFRVTDRAGAGVPGLAAADLRFNIAKLVPGSNGEPANWQNYLNRAVNGAVEGTEERLAAGFAFGTLVNRGDGSYIYTFATDITSATANPCPAPCTNADGKALNVSYQPGLTHRVTIQQGNSASPKATGVLDFVPAGGAAAARDIVLTATCNQCHGELTSHGTRVDTKLCVTCHNPGSWVAGPPNTSVDFKVMIHKIHYNNAGAALPSVLAGTPYKIGSKDFSTVVFTQDVRNCTKCHDGALSAQGDNWKNQPSMEACGSCHDNVYFGAGPDPARPYQTIAHPGGVMTDNSTCFLCHGPGRAADVTVAHNFPARLKAATDKFKFNIISATPTTPGGFPVVTFSVTDPTNGDQPYDIKADPHFTAIAGGDSTLAVSIGWNTNATQDFGNDGSAENFGQPISMEALANSVAGVTSGTYTVTSAVAIPATQTGTLRVTMEGHPASDVTTPGTFTDRLAVKSAFKDFAITGAPGARRSVVDIVKCNVCHGVLSLHGTNRTDEPGVCVVCHNPNATDASRRPSSAGVLTGGVDGKLEEAVDFRTMIHGIHAGQASNGGFRVKGITIYGSGGVNDFSTVAISGKLSNCTACHIGTSYQLTGIWASPTANGILGTTTTTDPAANTTTGPAASNAADNLRISPTAAVCSSCHDSALAKTHIQDPFNGGNFSATQAVINATVTENCTFCHGAGRALDVKTVHGIQ